MSGGFGSGVSGSGTAGGWISTGSGGGASWHSAGEAGGSSEQVLGVRERRRCWPTYIRPRDRLLRCLERLTFATGFAPGSSFTSSTGGWGTEDREKKTGKIRGRQTEHVTTMSY